MLDYTDVSSEDLSCRKVGRGCIPESLTSGRSAVQPRHVVSFGVDVYLLVIDLHGLCLSCLTGGVFPSSRFSVFIGVSKLLLKLFGSCKLRR